MSSIRVASYNLWNGANETYFRLIDFAKEQKFDVLCLQEINGWENGGFARLKDFADRAGYTDYEYGNSNSEYKLVTFSMLPITARTVHVEGFWHCVIAIRVKVGETELNVVNLHLDPWKEEPRLREVGRLLELIDVTRPTIITGDFNSLSRADDYSPEIMGKLQKGGIIKFGQGALDFRVTDTLVSAGFIDVAAHLHKLDTTVPSPYNTDMENEVPVRIDYVYANSAALPFVRDIAVMKNQETDKISDHYPVIVTLDTIGDVQPEPTPNKPAEPEPEQPKPTPEAEPENEPDDNHNTATEGEIKLH